jgi:hypothetical protein
MGAAVVAGAVEDDGLYVNIASGKKLMTTTDHSLQLA